jgi:hypothetical protein
VNGVVATYDRPLIVISVSRVVRGSTILAVREITMDQLTREPGIVDFSVKSAICEVDDYVQLVCNGQLA